MTNRTYEDDFDISFEEAPTSANRNGGADEPLEARVEPVDFDLPNIHNASGATGGFVPVQPFSNKDAYVRYDNGIPITQEQAELAASILKQRRRRKRRQTTVAVIVVLLFLVGAGVAGAAVYLNNLNSNLTGSDQQEAQEVRESLKPAPIGDEPFYMLLVGCDDREGVEGVRADTTILARLDPVENVVTLVSIPRDTEIELEGYGRQKFNAAYTYGGPSGTIDAVTKLTGADISHYAEVHFEALIDIIDYIGGVDVDVPVAIDDVDAGGKVDAGRQHLDGEHAMIFARSRSYETGDFQRTTSQRLLIEAAVDKVRSMHPAELPGLIMKVSECMTTDLSVQEMLGMAVAFQDEPELTMYSALPPVGTADIDGVSYVTIEPTAMEEFMKVVDSGKDPATAYVNEDVVTTSKEAEEKGVELIVNEGDDTVDGGVATDGGAVYYEEPVYYEPVYYEEPVYY